jgi:hypothetical protein
MIFMELREKEIIQAIRFCSLNVAELYEAYEKNGSLTFGSRETE